MKIEVNEPVRELKRFLLSQYFFDGFRITFGVVLPSLIFYHYGMLETGITFSLGALYVSITDNPGPVIHKRNAMIAAGIFIFLTALLTGFTNRNTFLLSLDIAVLCFFYSMFTVYGARASAVGIAALLTMVIGIDQHLDTYNTFLHAVCLLGGGAWYMVFSLLFNRALPYRPSGQVLGECMESVAQYLEIRSGFYDMDLSPADVSERLIEQQTLIHTQMENVRELLFKTRELLKDSSAQGNRLLMTFIDLVDLFEHSTELYSDYEKLRNEIRGTPVPETYRIILLSLSRELSQAGAAIHNHSPLRHTPQTHILLEEARGQIEELEKQGKNILALKRILVNFRNMLTRIEQIYRYQQNTAGPALSDKTNLDRFVSHKTFEFRQFIQNLSFRSAVFRHSIRMSLVCLAAFLFARYFYTGHHSYWILLTIIVILKPGFSQTRQRNIERIIGTLLGGLMGILILYFVRDETARFGLLLLFMLLTYSFVRIRYVVSVFFMTPFILIMFSFIGHNNDMLIVQERIIDTFIGAAIAALASYFILPAWESEQIKQMMADMILRNYRYLQAAILYAGKPAEIVQYRIARKEMYVSASNLSSAFQRMLNEPKRKRQKVNETNKFILINNQYASCTAALGQKIREGSAWSRNDLRAIRKVLHMTAEAYESLSGEKTSDTVPVLPVPVVNDMPADPVLVQLQQTAADLRKSCTQLKS